MVECNRCNKELTSVELEAGYNSDMYESKLCSMCIKESAPTRVNDDHSLEDDEDYNEEE